MTVLTLHHIVVHVSGRYDIMTRGYLTDRVIMVLIAIWSVQKFENAVHLTGHKDSGTKPILREKWRPAGTGFEGSKFRDFSVPPGHMACMNMRARATLRGVVRLLRISTHKNVQAYVD